MYYIKKVHQISEEHRDEILGLQKSGQYWPQEQAARIKLLADMYHTNWWMSYQEASGTDGVEARLLALKDLMGCQISMNTAVACETFRKALSQKGAIGSMLATIYEEVVDGTEKKFGHSLTEKDWEVLSSTNFDKIFGGT